MARETAFELLEGGQGGGLAQHRGNVRHAVMFWISLVLHAGLIVIHIAFIGALMGGEALNVQGNFTNGYATAFNSSMDSVIIISCSNLVVIVYTGILVFLIQTLALRHDLHVPNTVTDLHDRSRAWIGLGSAMYTLTQQAKIRTRSWRWITMIALYLGCISALHVTSPAIFSVQPYTVSEGQVTYAYLVLNFTPVIVGMVVSVFLFVISLVVTRRREADNVDPELTGTGILHILWLSGKHPWLSQRLVANAPHPTTDQLRRAGAREMQPWAGQGRR